MFVPSWGANATEYTIHPCRSLSDVTITTLLLKTATDGTPSLPLPPQDTGIGAAVPVGQGHSIVPKRVQIRRQEAGVAVEVQGLPAMQCVVLRCGRTDVKRKIRRLREGGVGGITEGGESKVGRIGSGTGEVGAGTFWIGRYIRTTSQRLAPHPEIITHTEYTVYNPEQHAAAPSNSLSLSLSVCFCHRLLALT